MIWIWSMFLNLKFISCYNIIFLAILPTKTWTSYQVITSENNVWLDGTCLQKLSARKKKNCQNKRNTGTVNLNWFKSNLNLSEYVEIKLVKLLELLMQFMAEEMTSYWFLNALSALIKICPVILSWQILIRWQS